MIDNSNILDTDEYLEILEGVERMGLDCRYQSGMIWQMVIKSVEVSRYMKRLKGGVPVVFDFDFLKRFWRVLSSVMALTDGMIDELRGDYFVEESDLSSLGYLFANGGEGDYAKLYQMDRLALQNGGVVKKMYLGVLMEFRGVLQQHSDEMDRRQKNEFGMCKVLNMHYEHYRDNEWVGMRQELAQAMRVNDDCHGYLREVQRRCMERFDGNFFKGIHNRCYDNEEWFNVDYTRFSKLIFLRGNRGWEMRDLEEYFDIVLTLDYVEILLRGGVKYTRHTLPNVDLQGADSPEERLHDEDESMVLMLDEVWKRMEGYLMPNFTVDRMGRMMRMMLMDEPLNNGHRRVQGEFREFIKNTGSSRSGEYMGSMAVQSLMRLMGVLCYGGAIQVVRPSVIVECVLNGEGSGKMETYRSYFYKGRNELARSEGVMWKDYLLAWM